MPIIKKSTKKAGKDVGKKNPHKLLVECKLVQP
jgi:hypothetical protein